MPVRIITEGLVRASQVVLDDITHLAVGTNATAPTPADVSLVVETNRIAITSAIRSGNTIQARGFFTNANLPATLEEVGLFLNGTGAADSGEMLVRATLTFVKGLDDLLLIFEIALSEA